jgi:hypothetical protein
MAEIDAQDVLDQTSPPLCKNKMLTSQVEELNSELKKARDMDLQYKKMLKPMLDERTIFDAKVWMTIHIHTYCAILVTIYLLLHCQHVFVACVAYVRM